MSYGNYPDLSKIKKILVVKMRHLGDVLLASPVFAALKKAIPGASIDVLIYKDTYPMLEGNEYISNFLLYERKRTSLVGKVVRDTQLYRSIRKNKYDLVINLTEGDRGAIAALVSGARIRVGFESNGKGFIGKGKAFTHLVKNCSTPRHAVEKDIDTLRKIGIFPECEERRLSFVIPEEALKRVENLLKEEGIEPGRLILIHPASRWRFKCWPTQQVGKLIKELHRQGHSIAITCGAEAYELAMVKDILLKAEGVPVVDLSGKLSLKELGALMRLSRALISVDTVAPHIACSLGLPLVVLFGPSSEEQWGPWMHPRSQVVAKNMSCRPCRMDGCGGSKMSDCLYSLDIAPVLDALNAII